MPNRSDPHLQLDFKMSCPEMGPWILKCREDALIKFDLGPFSLNCHTMVHASKGSRQDQLAILLRLLPSIPLLGRGEGGVFLFLAFHILCSWDLSVKKTIWPISVESSRQMVPFLEDLMRL